MIQSAFAIASTTVNKSRYPEQPPRLELGHSDTTPLDEECSLRTRKEQIPRPEEASRTEKPTSHPNEQDLEPPSFDKAPSLHSDDGEASRHLEPLTSYMSSQDGNDSVELTLTEDDRFQVNGICDLWVRKGSVALLGAMLHASHRLYRVEATETKPLPTIQLLRNPFRPSDQLAEIVVKSCCSAKSHLRQANLRTQCSAATSSIRFVGRSFVIEQLQPKVRYVQQEETTDIPPIHPFPKSLDAIAYDPRWDSQCRRLATKLSSPGPAGPRSILVCGTEDNGKASFSQFLVNHFLSDKCASSGIKFIDLDPLKPDYAPPACVALMHIEDLNLGCSSTHSWPTEGLGNKVLRCHFVGISLQYDELHHYLECSRNLFVHCRSALAGKECPLIVKSYDWVHRTQQRTLIAQIGMLRPTDVVVVGGQISDVLINEIEDICSQTGSHIHPLLGHDLNRRLGDAARDLLDIRWRSYFHLPVAASQPHQCLPPHYTNSTELFYGGARQEITGFLISGDEINYEMLQEVAVGTILAVVALESIPIASESSQGQSLMRPFPKSPGPGGSTQSVVEMYQESSQTSLCGRFRAEKTRQGFPIIHSGDGSNRPIDPTATCCLGFITIQAINVDLGRLTVNTPISQQTLAFYKAASTPLLLVKQQNYLRKLDDIISEVISDSVQKGPIESFSPTADECDMADSRLRGLLKPMFVNKRRFSGEDSAKAAMKRKNTIWRVRRNLKAS